MLGFATPAEWDAWVAAQPEDSAGVWLKLARRGSGEPGVTYDEALEVALRHGWIDAQKRSADGGYWLQRFLPRGPRSKWSKINRDKAETLIAAGRMTPAGRAKVDQARADGRWDSAYAGQATMTVPDDLRAALDAVPAAAAFFATLNGANRYAILYRVQEAKRPATRAARIEKYVAMCAEGRTLH